MAFCFTVKAESPEGMLLFEREFTDSRNVLSAAGELTRDFKGSRVWIEVTNTEFPREERDHEVSDEERDALLNAQVERAERAAGWDPKP